MIRDFNSMTSQIDYLIKKNETVEILRKETELKALQQQINPHFLYNTLEMVIGLASENENKKIIAICKNLGSMFRYNLNDRKVVLIEDELNQIKSYISILRQRFEGKFEVNYKINPDLLKYKTLKFILQPFVENSIGHGFSSITAGGLLTIQIDWSGEKILFLVEDNGKGIPGTVLEEIYKKFRSFEETAFQDTDIPDHLGIMNVFMRLKLMFRNDCTMAIESTQGSGTCIKIEIPPVI
jgi:sensor histidine kinase YesM